MIVLRELVARFGETTAVDRVSLEVGAGELLVLVGGSGSGKTTTLRMVNRLVEPTSGSVLLGGRDTREIPLPELRRSIGYVLQRLGLFPHLTVAENVAVPLELAGWPRGRVAERVVELLELVKLDLALGERRPAELSGGQQQRVGVARALAARPQVMLLDEPFGALDPLTRDHLQQSFLELKQQLGLTAILVTHDMAEALLLADRIAILRQGRVVQTGSPQQILQAPADPEVERLLDTPRRWAERYEGLRRG
jgi:osmoprotectant transport system ATP-binding protein